MPKWTDEQQKVIDLRDRNILVSAGAGSGKTAVLVERIIKIISDDKNPVDVDKLVIVTFTKAAASEMKERIGKAISKGLQEDPDNMHLQKQQTLIHNAHITTIDSFCLDIVRNYFHIIDLAPDFRIADQGELKLLMQDVLDDTLEELYKESGAEFVDFVECFATGKRDDNLKDIVMGLYDFATSYPDSRQWIRDCAKNYNAETIEDLENNVFISEAASYAEAMIKGLPATFDLLSNLASDPAGPIAYFNKAMEEQEMIEPLVMCTEMDYPNALAKYRAISDALLEIKFGSLPRMKKEDTCDDLLKETFQNIRNKAKGTIKDLSNKILAWDPKDIIGMMKFCRPLVETISEITIRFMDNLDAAKRDKKIVDFSDIEHFALQILTNPDGSQSDIAKQYARDIYEIFIDEYQDSNQVQEDLLRAVSTETDGKFNIFMVGDVKQSIYRFRMARPELFVEKYDTYSLDDSDHQRVDLHKNFRSRREVIDSVNFIFDQLMGKSVGNVEYDRAARLETGAEYPETCSDFNTEFVAIEVTDENKKELGLTNIQIEAMEVASRIKEMVTSKEFFVKDETDEEGKRVRLVRYGDIAILLRSTSGYKEALELALEEAGVPVYFSSQTGFFTTTEVQVVLSLLQVIDNPLQDIPLAAALKSPVVGLTAKELADIKGLYPTKSFNKAIFTFVKEPLGNDAPAHIQAASARLKSFFAQLEDFRRASVYMPVNELIEHIVTVTGYMDFVTAMPGGLIRRENIKMLMERAVSYEKTSYKGLFNFLRYVEQMKKYEIEFPEPEVEALGDKVRLMTIHKSKGLEFPVVFLCGTAKEFNKADENRNVVLHSDIGAGVNLIDYDRRLKVPTLFKSAISKRIRLDSLGEELRILYVALTRPKEKLIITGTTKSLEEMMAGCIQLNNQKEQRLPFDKIVGTSNYFDWLVMALYRNAGFDELREEAKLVKPSGNPLYNGCDCIKGYARRASEVASDFSNLKLVNKALNQSRDLFIDSEPEGYMDKIEFRFGYKYPFQSEINLKTKMSVSELKKRAFEELAPEEFETSIFNTIEPQSYIPNFVEAKEEHKGIQKGNLYHKILECYDYSANDVWGSFDEQVERMVSEGQIRDEDRTIIFKRAFKTFFESNVGLRIKAASDAGKLYREKPFVMGIPAREAVGDVDSDEIVIVQGIIDLYFEEDGEIVLLDYKTDRVDSEEELVKRYKAQLDLYEEAITKFSGKKVKEKIIYSFGLDKEIHL